MIILFTNNLFKGIYEFKNRELYNLIAVRSGGKNTIRIIDEILVKPKNANQIANILKLDYKTVIYHLNIICDHDYLVKEQFNNNYSYFPSDKLLKNLEEYNNIKKSLQEGE